MARPSTPAVWRKGRQPCHQQAPCAGRDPAHQMPDIDNYAEHQKHDNQTLKRPTVLRVLSPNESGA